MNITDAETFTLLQEISNDATKGDDFFVKVDFKPHPAAMPSRFAIFQHVHFEDIAVPEPWLQQLSENAKGHFVLMVSHASQPAKTLGGALTIVLNNGSRAEARFDWNMLESEDYRGPKDIVFPHRGSNQPAATAAAPIVIPKPKNETAASVIEALAPFITAQRQTGPDPFARYMEMQAEDRRREEARRSEERERQEKREEREEIRRREEKKEEREREEKREERERTYQREVAAAAQKSTETLITVLTKSNPMQDAMLQKAMNNGDEQASKAGALLGQMGMIMQQSMNMSLQMIHTQAELSAQNAPQSPVWDLAGKLVEGYFGMQGAQEEELSDALTETAEKKQLPEGDAAAPVEEEGDEVSDEPSVENPLQRLDRAIHQEAPLRELADALCMAMVTPDFQAIWIKHKGNVEKLVTERYGAWVGAAEVKDQKERKSVAMRRVTYLSKMLPKAYAVAKQRGIIRAPPAKTNPHAKPQPQAAKKRPALAAVKKDVAEPEVPEGEPEKEQA